MYYTWCIGQAGTEKYILQVSKGSKTITIAASNIISIESFDEELLMTLILPNNKEMNFKADSLQKLIQWVSSLKVAIGKGKYVSLYVCVCSVCTAAFVLNVCVRMFGKYAVYNNYLHTRII